jgi:hypothetical protein
MLAELRLLYDASRPDADFSTLRSLAVESNVLGKATVSNRRETLNRLRQLYGLDPLLALYRVQRELWTPFPDEQPLLALLLATARDPSLRVTAPLILAITQDQIVTPHDLARMIESEFPDRYGPKTLHSMSQNLASSWRQSGHLSGKLVKTRSRAKPGPGSVTYALWMGHLCGVRGRPLFDTLWAELLDAPAASLETMAINASKLGWIEYRSAGGVVEVGFRRLEDMTGVRTDG